jgi:hypothetical protein
MKTAIACALSMVLVASCGGSGNRNETSDDADAPSDAGKGPYSTPSCKAEGAPCEFPDECCSPMLCYDGFCGRPKSEGESCSSWNCGSSLYCDSGTCAKCVQPPPSVECTTDSDCNRQGGTDVSEECSGYLFCDHEAVIASTKHTCAFVKERGDPCESDEECATLHCGGTCDYCQEDGTSCTSSHQCCWSLSCVSGTCKDSGGSGGSGGGCDCSSVSRQCSYSATGTLLGCTCSPSCCSC